MIGRSLWTWEEIYALKLLNYCIAFVLFVHNRIKWIIFNLLKLISFEKISTHHLFFIIIDIQAIPCTASHEGRRPFQG